MQCSSSASLVGQRNCFLELNRSSPTDAAAICMSAAIQASATAAAAAASATSTSVMTTAAGREESEEHGNQQQQQQRRHNNNNKNLDEGENGENINGAEEAEEDKMTLSSKIEALQSTLEQVRQETEGKISKLRDELIEKNQTLQKLQIQLSQQTDYNDLKRQCQILKSNFPAETNDDHQQSSPPPPSTSPLSTSMATTTLPGPPVIPEASKGLEMFLLQRAKALQHANPALKALVDLQAAGGKPWLGELMKNAMAPPPPTSSATDPLSVWRRSLEQSLLPPPPPPPQIAASPAFPPTPSPHSPSNHAETASDRDSPAQTKTPPSIPSPSLAPNTNGNPAAATKEGHNSPHHPFDLKSPFKPMEDGNPAGGLFPVSSSMLQSQAALMSGARIPKSDPMEGALQDMMRYNMEKYAGQPLDTLNAARRVRELLSVHNIGQRLFAKYVLGLSQGTVSELLSKPKSWDKLTEKGRDSYRKMHAWAYDENAVMLLKSLIPRKGEAGNSAGGAASSAASIGSTNFEAHLQHSKFNPPKFPPSGFPGEMVAGGIPRLPFHHHHQQLPPLQGTPDRLNKPDFSKKLSPMSLSESQSSKDEGSKSGGEEEKPGDPVKQALQTLGFPGLGAFMGKTAEEMQRAVDIYQSELAKLQQRAMLAAAAAAGTKEEAASPVDDLSDDGKRKDENNDVENEGGKKEGDVNFKQSGHPSLGSLPPPGTAFFTTSANNNSMSSTSPLQSMASITNSLTAHPIPPPVYRPNQRSFKAILPPITQDQFDRCDNINTEELVLRIKEVLSQYSISQRLFGENILGLSQGSVSDLLARPKQFHMLTQKGKEPFIRMKMFLEDDQAVHKLVASQYKIAPEKLMRTGNYPGNFLPPAGPLMPRLPPPPSLKVSGEASSFMRPPSFSAESAAAALFNQAGGQRFGSLSAVDFQRKMLQEQQQRFQANMTKPGMTAAAAGPNSIYEMAALTQEINTQQLTTRVREALSANNIGQKLFGETILGLSQGSVSELLTKPKPWHMLSIKGREPFIRMHLWLNDPHNIEKLQAIKDERDSLKRKREASPSTLLQQQHSPTRSPSEHGSDPYSAGSVSSPGSAKKQRILFTPKQKEALKIAYLMDPYPGPSAVDFLAQELQLETRSVVNWFHNHRMRLKQQTTASSASSPSPPAVARASDIAGEFDPNQFRLMVKQRMAEFDEHQMQQSEEEGGLDLSGSGNHHDDDSRQSFGGKSNNGDEAAAVMDMMAAKSALLRASRRKPLAPQWVNPWATSSEQQQQQQQQQSETGDEAEDAAVNDDADDEKRVIDDNNGESEMNST